MEEGFYTTRELMTEKRADLWRQFISETFVELDCNGMSREDFFGELRARSIGNLGISSITTDAYDVFRTKSGVAGSKSDDFLVSVQTKGSSVIRQLGREAVLNPGDFTIYDSAAPYHLHFTNRLSQIVLQIPRELMKAHIYVPEALTAVKFRGGQGITELTTKFAKNAFRESLTLDERSQQQVAQTLLELLTCSIRQSSQETQRESLNRETQLVRIKQFVADRLKDSSLEPALIAVSHNISVRYLQMLFETENTSPARYIRDQRLEHAKRDLIHPSLRHHSVSQICFKWAFSDTAHFSRAFKSKYELSPREYRKQNIGL